MIRNRDYMVEVKITPSDYTRVLNSTTLIRIKAIDSNRGFRIVGSRRRRRVAEAFAFGFGSFANSIFYSLAAAAGAFPVQLQFCSSSKAILITLLISFVVMSSDCLFDMK